jgi:hypothetical protein
MLAYILAIATAVGSLALFLVAFFRPKLHRQDDFLWSGTGLFYALVLWLCAEQLRGGILIGQAAGVFLVLTFGWQTLKLRWAIANPEARAEIEIFSLLTWLQNLFNKPFAKKTKQVSPPPAKVEEEVVPVATPTTTEEVFETPSVKLETTPVVSEVVEEIVEPSTPAEVPVSEPKDESDVRETIVISPENEQAEIVTPTAKSSPAVKPTKEGFSLKNLFGFNKPKSAPKAPSSKSESIKAALDLTEAEDEVDEEASVSDVSATPEAIADSTPATEVEAYADYKEAKTENDEETSVAQTSEPVAANKTPQAAIAASESATEEESYAAYEEVETADEPDDVTTPEIVDKKDEQKDSTISDSASSSSENQVKPENPPFSPEI